MESSSREIPSKNVEEINKTDESKVSQKDDALPFSGIDEESSYYSNGSGGKDKDTLIPASVETNRFQRQISELVADGNESENNEENQREEPLATIAENGTARTTVMNNAEANNVRPQPDEHQTGSFRFYSDAGVEAPDVGAQLRIASDDPTGEEENPDLMFPDLALRSATNNSQDDNISISASVVNEPKRGMMDNRVSSRLLLAQETDMVPVNHSRGSEVAFKVKDFETMKQHLRSLVQAAEIYFDSTLELKEAHRTVCI
jgi:hypothetical protein